MNQKGIEFIENANKLFSDLPPDVKELVYRQINSPHIEEVMLRIGREEREFELSGIEEIREMAIASQKKYFIDLYIKK